MGGSVKDRCFINIGMSVAAVLTILWNYVSYGVIKNIMMIILNTCVALRPSKNFKIAQALGISSRNKLLRKAIDARSKFPGEDCTRSELEKLFAPSLRKRRSDAMTEAEERAAIKFWGDSCEVAPDTKSGHDSQFVRCYLEKSLLGPEGWLQTQTEFPGL
jgi:hypothetical protein